MKQIDKDKYKSQIEDFKTILDNLAQHIEEGKYEHLAITPTMITDEIINTSNLLVTNYFNQFKYGRLDRPRSPTTFDWSSSVRTETAVPGELRKEAYSDDDKDKDNDDDISRTKSFRR